MIKRKLCTLHWLGLGLLALGGVPLLAQDIAPDPDGSAIEAPGLPSTRPSNHPEVKPTPPPGEDVMRPTTHGIRFTRQVCTAFARNLVSGELDNKLSLDPGQKRKLTEAAERRIWDLNTRLGAEGATAVECLYETLIGHEGNKSKGVTAEDAKQISQKIKPGLKIIPSFWDGLMEDATPFLRPEQMESLSEEARQASRMSKSMDKRMERWSRGEVKENESLMDSVMESVGPDGEEDNTGKSKEYIQAERQAYWQVRSLGPEEWARFLGSVSTKFDFDDKQKAAGQELLKEYREKAKAIMTKEWMAKAKANQVRQSMRWRSQEGNLWPWLYRLEREYKDLTEPIEDLARAFRRQVVQLATEAQRNKVIAELQKAGEDRGMTPEEVGAIATALPPEAPQTQPEGQ